MKYGKGKNFIKKKIIECENKNKHSNVLFPLSRYPHLIPNKA